MAKSKIVQYVEALNPKQKERFRQFVNSPYFNQHKKTQQLLDVLIKQLNRKKPNISKEFLFKQLYPQEKFDEQKLFNVMSYLKKMYQKFLAYEYVESHETKTELLTLEAAFKHNRGASLLKNRARYLEKKINDDPQKDYQYYFTNYRINYLLGFHEDEYSGKDKQVALQKMLTNFDLYYMSEKLKMCCLLYGNKITSNRDYEFYFLEELLAYIRGNWDKLKENIVIKLYYHILMSQMEEDVEHYKKLKEILEHEFQYLNKEDQKNLYDAAQNYCTTRFNKGEYHYINDLFELCQLGVKTKMLLADGYISEWDYKNTTTIGGVLQKFDWTEQFLEDFKQYLPAHKRENAYNYNRANLFFHQKKYDKVQRALLNVQFTDVKYHINSTILLLRTYYKTGDTEALLSSIETFRIFIMRNKEITTNQKRGHTNFLRFKKKLALLKHNHDFYATAEYEKKLAKLKTDIEKADPVMNKYWLLEECKSK